MRADPGIADRPVSLPTAPQYGTQVFALRPSRLIAKPDFETDNGLPNVLEFGG